MPPGLIPTKLLLLGEPGVGKTTLAKAIAYATGRAYYFVNASDLLNCYQNSGRENIKQIIDDILPRYPHNSSGKCVIIIGELDELTESYFNPRDPNTGSAKALWTALDKCAENKNIFFIGTSNRKKEYLPEGY